MVTRKDSPSIHDQKEQQKEYLKLKECRSYIEINSQNVLLKEPIKKLKKFTIADNIDRTNNDNGEPEPRILNFEFSKSYWEVSNYAKPFFYKGNNSEIWFHGKIDITTGKVISSGFGRSSQQQ